MPNITIEDLAELNTWQTEEKVEEQSLEIIESWWQQQQHYYQDQYLYSDRI